MNRIYSKVWNPSLGMLVVASELARRAHGVMSSGARVRARLGVTLLASALLAGIPFGAAFAHDKQKGPPQNDKPQIGTGPAYCVDARGNPIKDGRPGENAVACGDDVDASGRHAVARRCEQLGLSLSRREVDRVYRAMIARADKVKVIDDASLRAIVASECGHSAVTPADVQILVESGYGHGV